jgi:hypothetical protein
MPLSKEKTLALSNALIKTTRKYVFFTPNIKSLYAEEYEDFRRKHFKNLYPMKNYKEHFNSHVGICGSLCWCIKGLIEASDLLETSAKKFSIVVFLKKGGDNHGLIIMHDSDISLASKNCSFSCFCASFPDQNAVICDPWIWKTTEIQKYKEHIDYADIFQVKDYYANTFSHFTGGTFYFNTVPKVININAQYNDLADFYYSELQRTHRNSFIYQRRLSSVRASLVTHIQQQQQQQQQLAQFISYIKGESSFWYSSFGHSNRKGRALQKIHDFCNQKVTNHDYIGEVGITKILKTAIGIALVPRGETTNQTKINHKTALKETKTGRAALTAFTTNRFSELSAIVNQQYQINNYQELIGFAGIDNFHNLYTGKVFYYTEAENLN